MIQTGRRMRSFIDDLLRYAQVTQETEANVTDVDTNVLLTHALFNPEPAIQSKGVKITHDPLPRILADARIEHVLQNLVSNAIKYSRPGVTPEGHISARE